ncbi:MAG: hypothetical protein HYS62_00390 [Candidatus Aenigmarchaeota archaeon]|nr:hypothetical protein [Candidatus Aenigmarchaeota archaeon]
MIKGKAVYLNRLYSRMKFKTMNIGENISGASPPGVFVGRFGYPKVSVGPLIPPQHGDTKIMDTPEEWFEKSKQVSDIIDFRFSLIRGKRAIKIQDVQNKTVRTLQEIALAKNSMEIEAEFTKKPRGVFFNEDVQPFGPSAPLKEMKINNTKMEPHMEKVYYDTDLKAKDAIVDLYDKGVVVSAIQKALSIGAFGLEKNRKLVPTRWSITTADDTLGLHFLTNVRNYPLIENYQVYEYTRMNNTFFILLMPTYWQYEFLEAFIRVLGNEEVLFSDWEPNTGKKEYASIGGCFYSTRLGILEFLDKHKTQAGALVFRESYPNYTPLGVWLVRECTRSAMSKRPKEFDDMRSALNYISGKLWLPFSRYKNQSVLLKQSLLTSFFKGAGNLQYSSFL